MSVVENLKHVQKEHKHETHKTPKFRAIYCEICYPPPTKLSEEFVNFWNWISDSCTALSYTSYTTTTFRLYITIYSNEPVSNNTVSYRVTDFSYRIIGSLTYEHTPDSKALVYYLINLTPRTKYFAQPVIQESFEELKYLIDVSLTEPKFREGFDKHYKKVITPEDPTNMDEDALRNLLTQVLGRDGLNIQGLLHRDPAPRELSLIKVDTFSGKENENPYEWVEMFENAAEANNWPTHRLQAIAPGYFKDAARDWYVANKDDLTR
jgi:hypothetical protein